MSARYEYNVASAEVAPCRLDTTAPDTTPTFYVVDESWSVRNSLRRLLRSYGFRVFTIASGSELSWLPSTSDKHGLLGGGFESW
jgi:hypothetical protein